MLGLRAGKLVIPVSIWGVFDQVAVEVLGAILPPDRAPLAKCNLCRINGASSIGETLDVIRQTSSLDLSPGSHQLVDEGITCGWCQSWIGNAPQATAHHHVSPVGGQRRFQAGPTLKLRRKSQLPKADRQLGMHVRPTMAEAKDCD